MHVEEVQMNGPSELLERIQNSVNNLITSDDYTGPIASISVDRSVIPSRTIVLHFDFDQPVVSKAAISVVENAINDSGVTVEERSLLDIRIPIERTNAELDKKFSLMRLYRDPDAVQSGEDFTHFIFNPRKSEASLLFGSDRVVEKDGEIFFGRDRIGYRWRDFVYVGYVGIKMAKNAHYLPPKPENSFRAGRSQ